MLTIMLISGALAGLGAIGCRWSYTSGRDTGYQAAQVDGHTDRIQANRAASPGRHQRAIPRQTPDNRTTGQPDRPAPHRDPGGNWVTRHDPPGTPRRLVTTAADLAGPVFIPHDGTVIPGRPRPAGYPDTYTSAGLAARTDTVIARMQRDGEKFRREQAQQARADRAAILAAIG